MVSCMDFASASIRVLLGFSTVFFVEEDALLLRLWIDDII